MEDLFSNAQNQFEQNNQQVQGYQQIPMQGYPQQQMMGQSMQGYPQQQMVGQSMQDYQQILMQSSQNMMNPYGGRIDSLGYVHYSRGQVIQMLRDYIVNNTGRTIVREERLDDYPSGGLRHCCVESVSKITNLQPYTFMLPEAGIQFQFYFCMDCCKLFYPKDFMY